MKTTKTFVTGITSGIVQELLSSINLTRFAVTGLSRTSKRAGDNITLVNGDLLNPDSYATCLQDAKLVIHAAALTHSFNQDLYYQVNFQGTKNLVDSAIDHGVEQFVFISTRAVGKDSGAYGHSKLLAEEYIREKFPNHIIIRPAEVFGIEKNEGIEKLIHDAIEKKLLFYPAGVPSGLSPIHVDDVVNQIISCLNEYNGEPTTVTVCGEREYSYKELIQKIAYWTDSKKILLPVPKTIIFAMYHFLRFSKVRVGMVPDQIPRLYSVKDISTTRLPVASVPLQTYVKQKASEVDGRLH